MIVCTFYDPVEPAKRKLKNTIDYMLRAVNSHDDLVSALKKCRQAFKHSFSPTTVMIDAALAKAEARKQ